MPEIQDPTPPSLFSDVRLGDWSLLAPFLGRSDLAFVRDLWSDFRSVIDALPDAQQRTFADMLQVVCSFHLRLDSDDVYGPMWVMDGKRSPVPTDLSKQAIEVLAVAFDGCPHLALRARIGDVVWIAGRHIKTLGRRRFDLACSSVRAYQQTADQVHLADEPDPLHWMSACEGLQRAAQIARETNNEDVTRELDQWLIQCIEKRKPLERTPICRELLEIRLQYQFVAPAMVVTESLSIAERLHGSGACEPAEVYFDLALRAAAKSQDVIVTRQCHRDCARSAVAIAKQYLRASPDAWAPAVGQYNRALNHLRQAGAEKNETDPIQTEILRLNRQGVKSCGSIGVPIDLTDLNKLLDAEFGASEFSRALFVFLFRVHTPKGYAYQRHAGGSD